MSTSQTELQYLTPHAGIGVPISAPSKAATTTTTRDQYAAAAFGIGTSSGDENGDPATDRVHDSHSASQEFSSLPPVDGGKQAWLFLAACFAVEMLVWGFPFAFGVFQNYYSTNPPFAGQPNIAVIGTCAMGIMYLGGPIQIALLRLYPRQSRYAPILGLLIMCFALAMSSFSTTVTHLIVTQGVFYAVGGSITYMPCILYIDQWFVRRKGFAYGIMWSGTGLAGVVLPLLMEYLLGSVGFRTTLRLWSGLLFALTAPLAFFIKPRLPVASHTTAPAAAAAAAGADATHARPFSNMRFLLSRPFLLHQAANTIEALGFFLPGIYLPSFAQSTLGASAYTSALTILLINVASVVGCVAMGTLVDRWSAPSCLLLASGGAALGTFLLWGLSLNLGVLYLFCVVYGLFAGAYTSAWPGIMKTVTEHERSRGRGVDPIMVFGMLAAGRGVGNVISGPLSETLVKGAPWRGDAGFGYGSGYGTLIVFTGVTALVGGATFGWKRFGWM
ncbi:major facilitator superfamily transporter [Colletotrichum orchidophilum]|uniref:Major facilitator superfamily transporter n=1 Tax=Colletotrichum orchidophilum TaxID=1209926 RepID=A0A1G4B2N7_9PEZI|nr:major facilitator superfamily transporter [Colletotrichum orchidophilum]OHE95657.1 major facilitator superfamily transporter [Colletotrichum orchidophilum]